MNQILSTQMPNGKNKSKGKKANIKSVIVFFCIIIIIFAIAIIGLVVYSQLNNDNTQEGDTTVTRPRIDIVESSNTLDINITHNKEIATIVYGWSNEETTQINGDGETSFNLEDEIPSGTNTFSITVTDIDGVQENYTAQYTGVEELDATINIAQEDNEFIVTLQSATIITKVSYYYDNETPTEQEFSDTNAEITIEARTGEHDLTIIAEDETGKIKQETNKIYVPTLEVVTDTQNFIIQASDTRGITRVVINFNGNEEEIEVNNTTYENTIPLIDGENRIIVTVYNSDGVSTVERVRWVKE